MQTDLLAAHPGAPVRVYAVSFHMLPSDHLARRLVWPEDAMVDPRVLHFWDETRAVGLWYEENVTRRGRPEKQRVEWDAYFLYEPEATWGDAPPEHVSWGRPIIGSKQQLRTHFNQLVAEQQEEPSR